MNCVELDISVFYTTGILTNDLSDGFRSETAILKLFCEIVSIRRSLFVDFAASRPCILALRVPTVGTAVSIFARRVQ